MSGFLDAPGPRWFSIPAHRPFLGDLAEGVWRALSPLGEDILAGATILVPTRRSTRDLAEAFLAAADRPAMILPQVRALGLPGDGDYTLEEALDDLADEARTALFRLSADDREIDHAVEAALSRTLKKAAFRIWKRRPVVETTVLRL